MSATSAARQTCHCTKKCGGPLGVGNLVAYSTYRKHVVADNKFTGVTATASAEFLQFLSQARSNLHTTPTLGVGGSLQMPSPSLDESVGSKRIAEDDSSDDGDGDGEAIQGSSKRIRLDDELGMNGGDEQGFAGMDDLVLYSSMTL
jgi:hypothetical protein